MSESATVTEERVHVESEEQEPRGERTVTVEPDAFQEVIVPIEDASNSESLTYKGIKISGLPFFAEQGILTEENVTELLDRLPEGFATYVPLGEIRLEPFRMFTVERKGGIALLEENDIQEGDMIQRRVRGLSQFNTEIVDGLRKISDGQMTLQVFSTKDWADKPDGQTDTDIASFTLSHELGHALYNFITKAIPYYRGLLEDGKPLPRPVHPNWPRFMQLAHNWSQLSENQLQRYQEYLPIFTKEITRVEKGIKNPSFESARANEDFAISYEHELYWQDLDTRDPRRHEVIRGINNLLQNP